MPTSEDFNQIDHDAVLDAMSDRGLDIYWEYPGVCAIQVSPKTEVWTGLHSYAYGDVSVLNEAEDAWEPLGEGGNATTELDEYETDPATIAEAWVEWVRNYRRVAGID